MILVYGCPPVPSALAYCGSWPVLAIRGGLCREFGPPSPAAPAAVILSTVACTWTPLGEKTALKSLTVGP